MPDNPFSDSIAKAAEYEDHSTPDRSAEYDGDEDGNPGSSGLKPKTSRADALKLFEELSLTLPAEQARQQVQERTGYKIKPGKSVAYIPKEQWAYDLWKSFIPLFLEGMWLNLGPKQIAEKACIDGRVVTAKMISAPITGPASKALAKMVREKYPSLKLTTPVSIRSAQKQIIAWRAAADGEEVISIPRIEIKGDSAYLNGKSYKIQRGNSGQRRIRRNGQWLNLDQLISFLSD